MISEDIHRFSLFFVFTLADNRFINTVELVTTKTDHENEYPKHNGNYIHIQGTLSQASFWG